MGCKTYNINGHLVRFSESRESCLCTFPHNYLDDGIDFETVIDLALLGAVTRLILDGYYDSHSKDECIFIPGDLPEWIIEGIDAVEKGVGK